MISLSQAGMYRIADGVRGRHASMSLPIRSPGAVPLTFTQAVYSTFIARIPYK